MSPASSAKTPPSDDNNSAVTQVMDQIKALDLTKYPQDVADKLKDLQLTKYPADLAKKIQALDLSKYPAEIANKLKSIPLGKMYNKAVSGVQNLYQDKFLVRKYIYKIQLEAINKGASDIFLASGAKPSCRVHGKTIFLEDEPKLDTKVLGQYLNEVMTKSDHKKLTENLEHDFSLSIEGGYRFRVNAFAQKNGISITMRTIPNAIPTFEELDLPESLLKIVDMPSGLVLVTGSTGSGKSTTLAAIINLINEKYNKHIITIEDPIEFIHQSQTSLIEQREVGLHSKSFANALRSALRQAPDVILVGELRDLETTALAITAAETGSLVLGTLHSNSSSNTISRLIDIFPADQQNQIRTQVSESLQAVIWQTLVDKKDAEGRVAAFEVLFANTAVENLIRENKIYQLPSVIETGVKDGMLSMKTMTNYLLKEGLIEEATAKKLMDRDK